MDNTVQIRTSDRDWGLTVYFWCRDLIEIFSKDNPSYYFVIQDTSHSASFECRKNGNTFLITAPASLLFLKRTRWIEYFRKILVITGFSHDMMPVDYVQLVKRLHQIRGIVSQSLGVALPIKATGILLRVDDFPSPHADSKDFLKFHEIARHNKVPYLLGVTPFFERNQNNGALTSAEIEVLNQCSREGMDIALHGFTHQKRTLKPASELAGMPILELRKKIDEAMQFLHSAGLSPSVFIAPFNTYDSSTVHEITARFPVFCGGPESIHALMGRMPSFFHGSLYQPSYRGVYDLNEKTIKSFEKILNFSSGCDLVVTMHWANEIRNGLDFFEKFCQRFAACVTPWTRLAADVNKVNVMPL